jgi:hypothetical protein
MSAYWSDMAGLGNISALGYAEDVVQAKKDYDAAAAAGDRAGMEKAHSRANTARDKLRSQGYGAVADAVNDDDTLSSATSALGWIGGLIGNKPAVSDAPQAGGTPQETHDITTGGSGSPSQVNATVYGPATTDISADTLANRVTKGVTDTLSGILGSLNTGVKAGAQGTAAAAGGLAQTVGVMANWLIKIAFPVVVIWGAVKIFRFSAKVGGK